MTTRSPKPVVTSWDVFDTLVTRFEPDPMAVFRAVDQAAGVPGFFQRRLDAQAALDKVGQPYVVHDIYRRMVAGGMAAEAAPELLRQEIAIERQQMIPIQRNVARVAPADLIISDMYLSPEIISAFLFEACGLHVHRPIIRSNWGKHTGTIWPLILNEYVIRRHVGDNPHSDVAVPARFKILGELTQEAKFSGWEQKLLDLDLAQLARIQREVRLRCVTGTPTVFHEAVVGPYLTLLACLAIGLRAHFGPDAQFAFLSRGADELARVFVALFPEVPVRTVDMSRRLINGGEHDQLFAAAVTADTVVVDLISSGRSFFRFAERNGHPGRSFVACVFLDGLLSPRERELANERMRQGRFQALYAPGGKPTQYLPLEHLAQSPRPPVAGLTADPKSGGVVRRFGVDELDADEAALIAWKSGVVTELVRTILRRGLRISGKAPILNGPAEALRELFSLPQIMTHFSSFRAREAMDGA